MGSHTPADTRRPRLHKCHPSNTCAHRHSAHVHIRRCTDIRHLSTHTPPLQRPHVCSHTISHTPPHPTHSLSVYKHPSLEYTHTPTRAVTPKHSPPSPLSPLPLRHPHEPAPALLSTRDWPTRIRILDARMDRQKFSKMMERSDFMNLRGHRGQRQRS